MAYGFDRILDFKLQDLKSKTTFSIIIPFRNEEKHLPILLNSISKLNYPKDLCEILFIDDASDDNSVNLVRTFSKSHSTFNIRILKNHRKSNSPKKDAIETAIDNSTGEWIITTDADCSIPKYWLEAYDEFIQTNKTVAISGPVKLVGVSSFFNRFQILDFLSLQGATIGSFGRKRPFMCNGANFAYTKAVFKSINGYLGNNNIASGDDTFLLEKLAKSNKKQLYYLKSEKAIVTTPATQNLKALVSQRLRWASKAGHYSYSYGKLVGVIVLLANLACVALIPLVLLHFITLRTAGLLFMVKFSIDLLLIFKASRFFRQAPVLLSYPFVSIIYPFFSVYIAIASRFMSYKWKGRTFKK